MVVNLKASVIWDLNFLKLQFDTSRVVHKNIVNTGMRLGIANWVRCCDSGLVVQLSWRASPRQSKRLCCKKEKKGGGVSKTVSRKYPGTHLC